MFGLKGSYSDLWKAIIRPPRDEYKEEDLGPNLFRIGGNKYKRTDLELTNDRNLKLKCSHYEPVKRVQKELPCVIYMHGNCSSRLECQPYLHVLLPNNVTVFSLDCSGCGKSEGEYISLGWFERDDISTVVQHLRNSGKTSTIGLWGRSMGAVSALMHADRDPSIAGLVLDSPFSSLRTLAEELCKQHSSIPKFVMSAAMVFIKSTIKDKAKFDIDKLNPLENHVKQAFIPALFVCAKGDTFVQPQHTKDLHEAYAGDKNLIEIDGDHNSARPQFLLDSAGIFFYQALQVEHVVKVVPGKFYEEEEEEQQQNSNSNKNKDHFGEENTFKSRKIGNEDSVREQLNVLGGGGSGGQKKPQSNNNQQQQQQQDFFGSDLEEEQRQLERAIQESLKFSAGNEKPQQKVSTSKTSLQPSGDNDDGVAQIKEDEESKNQQDNIDNYFMNDDDNDNKDQNSNSYNNFEQQQQQQQQQIQQDQQQKQYQEVNQQQQQQSDQVDDLLDL